MLYYWASQRVSSPEKILERSRLRGKSVLLHYYLFIIILIGESPLADAINGGHIAIVRYLLNHGADRDKADDKGFTSLHIASEEEVGTTLDIATVELLLSKGASIDAFSNRGTPLHLAATNGHHRTVKILLDHNADCNKIVLGVYSPLLVSIYAHSLNCVKLLIKAGADVNGVSNITPLIAAVADGLTECMKCLLEAGADPNVPDEAMALDHDDATMFSNRSLCFLKMGEGEKAFAGAYTCKMRRPDWPKAYYRRGAALMLLKDYAKACDTLFDGFKMDPGNAEIETALWYNIYFSYSFTTLHFIHDGKRCHPRRTLSSPPERCPLHLDPVPSRSPLRRGAGGRAHAALPCLPSHRLRPLCSGLASAASSTSETSPGSSSSPFTRFPHRGTIVAESIRHSWLYRLPVYIRPASRGPFPTTAASFADSPPKQSLPVAVPVG
ncbi:hypothetical protein PR202_gb08549 [Eleusine coracana subsp. coracana]|uniref:Uncharacterized protein n=1 Tax=Eleusine coracana subsp. coracana TaxID=191504 RepID=A0AAV5EEX7_ELECO|nr:hypothetical protein PR202_gb08549 [Eleusine coracana subsp. coracana]